jgi:iron complex transport system ATP-binding protein
MRLVARNLDIGYRHHVVGRDISLALEPGEVLCLLGPNGAGKTTLFRTLLGLQRALGGTVLVDETPLAGLRPVDIARCMAYVPQAHVTEFSFSVLDVVLMGRTARLRPFASPGAADERIAREKLDDLGISDLADGGLRAIGAPHEVVTAPILSAIYRTQVIVEETASGRRVCVPAWGAPRREISAP